MSDIWWGLPLTMVVVWLGALLFVIKLIQGSKGDNDE